MELPEWKRLGITPTIELGRFVAKVRCECGATVSWSSVRQPPPEIVAKKFRERGWEFGKKVLCPACQRKPRKSDMGEKQIQPTANAKKARLEALDLLREEFDADAGRYKVGSSDKTIAEITGLAPEAVVALREEWFGPIKEPKEIAELRAQLAEVQQLVEAIQHRLSIVCKELGVSQ